MSEQRRKGEKEGKRLTPGERAINWMRACKEGWPVFLGLVTLLGVTNSDRIMSAVSVPELDGITEVQPGGASFEQLVAKALTEANGRMDSIQGEVAVLRADLAAADRKIESASAAANRDTRTQVTKELDEVKVRLTHVEELVN